MTRMPHHALPTSWATPLELWYDLVDGRESMDWQERTSLFSGKRWWHAARLVNELVNAGILRGGAQASRGAAYTLKAGVFRSRAEVVARAIALKIGPMP